VVRLLRELLILVVAVALELMVLQMEPVAVQVLSLFVILIHTTPQHLLPDLLRLLFLVGIVFIRGPVTVQLLSKVVHGTLCKT
jgi:hypothetical protein